MTSCRWHDHLLDDTTGRILVGFVETGSGPGRTVWACAAAVKALDLLPLDEHPDGTDGTPRTRSGGIAPTPAGLLPLMPNGRT